ncbi:hypothetical protein [Neobacillus sp. Marseille-QA0830]
MLLLIISFLILAGYSVYFCLDTKAKKQHVSSVTGKCISMSLGMVSSTLIGLIVARFLSGELAYSTVLSIVISFILAYFIGSLFGLSGIMEAMGASFMGAMMGAMLGDMVPENRETFILIAMDIIFLFSVISLSLMVQKETVKETKIKVSQMAPLICSFVFTLSVIGLTVSIESHNQNANKISHMKEHNH